MAIANKEFDLLRAFLTDMFQFEDHDLDFGIYRIIRLKRRFIQSFIDGDSDSSLRTTVTRALSGVRNSQGDTARNWLSAFAANFGTKGTEKWQAEVETPNDEKAIEGLKSLFALVEDVNGGAGYVASYLAVSDASTILSRIAGSFLITSSPRRTAMDTPADPSPVAMPASFPV